MRNTTDCLIFNFSGAMKGVDLPKEAPQRVELVEEHTQRFGGPVYKQVKPKTYKILQQELDGPDGQPQVEPAAVPEGQPPPTRMLMGTMPGHESPKKAPPPGLGGSGCK